MSMQPLLIELGTEELPVKALPGLAQALFDGVVAALDKRGIRTPHTGQAAVFAAPSGRVVAGCGHVLLPQTSEVLGPYLEHRADADGQPDQGIAGLCRQGRVDWTALEKPPTARASAVHRATTAGAATRALLQDVLAEAMAAMPIPAPMRWGAHSYGFARPLHWLVALLGDEIVDVAVLGISAGRMSRGHRFMHEGAVWIARPGDYIDALRAAHVLVDPDERRNRVLAEVEAAANTAGGSARITDDNLQQAVCLNEWPVAVACAFERELLSVPQEALIETMENNQSSSRCWMRRAG